MKTKIASAVATALLLSGLCATHSFAAEFVPYQGKTDIKEGDGGGKKTVDGIDFWSDGDPPLKYKLLGFLIDERHKSGLFGSFAMSSLETDIAADAKNAGGDAVILLSSEIETYGAGGNHQRNHTKYAVVKYMADMADDAIDQTSK